MRSQNRTTHTHGFNIILGVIICLMLNIAGGVLITSMLQNNTWPDTMLNSAALGVLFVSALLGVIIVAIFAGNSSIQETMIIALCYYILEVAVGILFFDSTLKNAGWGAVSISIGSACAWLIAIQFRPKRAVHNRRSR